MHARIKNKYVLKFSILWKKGMVPSRSDSSAQKFRWSGNDGFKNPSSDDRGMALRVEEGGVSEFRATRAKELMVRLWRRNRRALAWVCVTTLALVLLAHVMFGAWLQTTESVFERMETVGRTENLPCMSSRQIGETNLDWVLVFLNGSASARMMDPRVLARSPDMVATKETIDLPGCPLGQIHSSIRSKEITVTYKQNGRFFGMHVFANRTITGNGAYCMQHMEDVHAGRIACAAAALPRLPSADPAGIRWADL